MIVTALSTAHQDYLKTIWAMTEWDAEPVTSKALGAKLGQPPSTVSETVRRLTERGLLRHAPYGTIELSEAGRAAAVQMVRRHRLLETFLVDYLDYAWDEVHDEAEILEHAVSDAFVERLDDRLGRPVRDPHGDPIPSRDGSVPGLGAVRLSERHDPATFVVARVSDADPDLLRHLTGLGVVLDSPLVLVERRDFAGTLAVEIGGIATELGLRAAEAIWVLPAD
ncbi:MULTISPECIES: metal-dependent transcriptional regulator [unclassified Mumia]|uniref:metal-dependent transcriptional regulator n=1 Tax=unclassified Mumia TaxID=2621872 RepID=UPI0026362956|nr:MULTISPECIES: metal-dependent transcriptional regulator [unclassified Mumia]MDD9348626.1 metal-dependent transcriptional regulator [Mumia sp.]